jgi:DNA-binding winged helix-turn-helix (wHTH) protein
LSSQVVAFPPFVLDPTSGRLLRDGETIHLRPRTWKVLCYLAERPGRLVTKDDLLAAVWSDAVVSEGTLSNSIRELRAALDDDAQSARYIQTVHRRGFRFIASLVSAPAPRHAEAPTTRAVDGTSNPLVGRQAELDELLAVAAEAKGGTTRVVLVSGEAGIGKSSVVDRFVATLASGVGANETRVVVGRAVGYLQGAPPYLVVLSALEALATSPDGPVVLAAMRAHVPDVLHQMPWLCAGDPGGMPATEVSERQNLTSRLATLFEALASHFPLVIVLEDLHDADAPTVEFVASLLESHARLRLMILVTYRPGEAVLASNGLFEAAQAACRHPGGLEIRLELLGTEDVAAYLQHRNASFWTEEMACAVHHQSGGNPLFMVTVADTAELTGSVGAAVDRSVPDSLRGLLETQLRTLKYRERDLLMTAAAVGAEFSSLVVAAASDLGLDAVEEICETLARQSRFLRTIGVVDWPSGGVGQAYAFRHQLYRSALYETLVPARRRAMHQRIGEALEEGYAGATLEVAAELADHFARSNDHERAIKYLRDAAQLARTRFAHREAVDLLDRAFTLLGRQPAGAERDQVEFGLEMDRAASAGARHGYGSAIARVATEKVELLAERLPPSRERFVSLGVVYGYHLFRSDVPAATRVAEHLTRAAKELDWPLAALGATSATAIVAHTRGDYELADRSARIVLAEMPADFRLPNFRDVLSFTRTAMAQNLCYLDRRAEAESVSRDAIERADWLEDPYEMAHTRMSASYCAMLFGDLETTRHWAAEAATISRRYDIEVIALITEILAAWADSDGALAARRQRISRALEGLDKTGHLNGKGVFLGLLAELEIEAGDLAAAADSLAAARAFCESTASHCHLAELYRRSAWVEERLGARPGRRGHRPRALLEEAERIARRQDCALVLRRLRSSGGGLQR